MPAEVETFHMQHVQGDMELLRHVTVGLLRRPGAGAVAAVLTASPLVLALFLQLFTAASALGGNCAAPVAGVLPAMVTLWLVTGVSLHCWDHILDAL